MPEAPFALEAHYREYLRQSRLARQADRAMQACLRRGERREAQMHLGRRWRALRRMRDSLERGWPGLEVFARRELSARGVREPGAAIAALHTRLRTEPPKLSPSRLPVAGLYAWIRRALRDTSLSAEPVSPA